MPELPEVECLTRAMRGVIEGGKVVNVAFHREDLREPIPMDEFRRILEGQQVESVFRRSKYILVKSPKGFGILHLGMTGNILEHSTRDPKVAHTHAVIEVQTKRGRNVFLHFVDPRRFGRIDCFSGERFESHPMFEHLGPEPLEHPDLGKHLFKTSRNRKTPIKAFIMDAKYVVGVGNIYASEALFRARISPLKAAGLLSRKSFDRLAVEIKKTLLASIDAGGTTFRDFRTTDGNPGYFAVSLNVYDRAGQPCTKCENEILQVRQSGRSTFYCPVCQS